MIVTVGMHLVCRIMRRRQCAGTIGATFRIEGRNQMANYQEGNLKAERRAEAITLMLQDFGIEEERFKLAWVSASEGPQFAKLMTEFTEQIKRRGPSPYKS